MKDSQIEAAYEAEEALCCALLMAEQARDEVLDLVDPRDIVSPQVGAILRVVRKLFDAGQPIAPPTIAAELRAAGDWDRIVTAADFARIMAAQASPAHAEYFAGVVRDAATIRTAAAAGVRIAAAAHQATDAEEVRSEATAALETILSRDCEKSAMTWGEAIRSAFATLEDRWNQPGADVKARTGLESLDYALAGGFRAGQLIVLAARPSVGKSSLATQMAFRAAVDRDTPTLLVSLEMSAQELAERIVAQAAQIPLADMLSGDNPRETREKIVEAMSRTSEAPLWVCDKAKQGIRSIAATARRYARRDKLALVVIDYLQLIEPDNPKLMREQQVATMTRQLKLLAKDLQVPIVLLCQLNRDVEKQARKPRLSDLRESGAIEQDADVVMFLHREDDQQRHNVDCIIAKQRCGAAAVVPLTWIGRTTTFIERQPTAAELAAAAKAVDFGPDWNQGVVS